MFDKRYEPFAITPISYINCHHADSRDIILESWVSAFQISACKAETDISCLLAITDSQFKFKLNQSGKL